MPAMTTVRVATAAALLLLVVAVGFGIKEAGSLSLSSPSGPSQPVTTAAQLPTGGLAPEFTGIQGWVNSPPLTLSSLRGKVVLVDFWTYSCINCQRTLPFLSRWWSAYKDRGLVIVGVHSPEFDFEKDPANVRRAVAEYGITWPVALDPQMGTWNAYGNQYWPAEYLIDQQGHLRREHFGEGEYDVTEAAIRALLGAPAPQSTAPADMTPTQPLTDEAYVGTARSDGRIRLGPGWTQSADYAIAPGQGGWAEIDVHTARAFMVASPSSGAPVRVYVTIDGRPPAAQALPSGVSQDASGQAFVDVSASDLYPLLALGQVQDHTLRITAAGPLQLFTFTFGS